MLLVVADISKSVIIARSCFTAAEVELNAADAKLGDGDTGSMLKRLSDSVAGTDLSAEDDLGNAFMKLAKAASAATGSSLGTLIMTGLILLSKATSGETSMAADRLPVLVADICQALLARGGAALGDKTVIDGLHAIGQALAAAGSTDYLSAAAMAARQALNDFQNRPNLIGRARVYGDRSKGLDDPGMLALAFFCDALAADGFTLSPTNAGEGTKS